MKTFPKEGPEAFAPLLPSILKAVMDKEVGFPTNNLHGIEIRNSGYYHSYRFVLYDILQLPN